MVYPAERRVLWHPRHASRFAVGGPGSGNITIYEYSEGHPSIQHVTSHDEMPYMRCLAWSPDPSYDDLMAIGMSSGKIDLLRMESNRQAGRNGVLSRGSSVTIGVKSSRACNVLAFSTVSPNLLAAGLDKVRGDQSLVVWDLNSPYAKFTSLGIPDTSGVDTPYPHSPIANHSSSTRVHFQAAAAETITALSFCPSSEYIILAGVAGRFLRLYDTRLGSVATTATPVNIPCKVQALTMDPLDNSRFACWGDGVITLWDRRHMSVPTLTFSTADAVADGARAGAELAMVEFSSERRGLLATLERDAAHLRFWDVLQAPAERKETKDGAHVLKAPREGVQPRVPKLSWTNPAAAIMSSWTGSGSSQVELTPVPEHSAAERSVLANTWKTQAFPRPLVAFALLPKAMGAGQTTAIVVNRQGDLEVHSVQDAPKQAMWCNHGILTIGSRTTYRFVAPNVPLDHLEAESDRPVLPTDDDRPHGTARRTSIGGRSDSTASSFHIVSDRVQQVVDTDISVVMKKRVRRGYSVANPLLNASICQEQSPRNSALSDIWTWVDHSQRILGSPESRILGFSFAHQGIQGIWEGFPPSGPVSAPDVPASSPMPSVAASPASTNRTLLDVPSLGGSAFPSTGASSSDVSSNQPFKRRSKLSRRSRSPAESIHGDFHDAVVTLLGKRGITVGAKTTWRPLVATGKLPQRRLALELCTWDVEDESMQVMAKRWTETGRNTQAACWFALVGKYSKAVDALMRSNDKTHHMLSATIAAFASLSEDPARRNELRQHCERLIPRLDDPYLRVMFTRLTSDDWTEVLDEEGLPLRECVFLALHFLDDGALGAYLRRMADAGRAKGELHVLFLAGLGAAGLDAIQSWLDATGDVQTAAALAARIVPGKAQDVRVGRWIDTYRELLDGWQMFHERCDFDIARGEILGRAVAAGDIKSFEWAPKQLLLRCNYCSKVLDSPAQYDGRPTVCPFCKRPLPRCSICLLTLRVIPDGAKEAELLHQATAPDVSDEPLVICQTCRHGGHASHIMDWFFDEDGNRLHKSCPVADCECSCVDEP